MKKLDCSKIMDDDFIDGVIEYLNDCAIIASRSGHSYDFTLFLIIITLLVELKYRRSEMEDQNG